RSSPQRHASLASPRIGAECQVPCHSAVSQSSRGRLVLISHNEHIKIHDVENKIAAMQKYFSL
ncbi:MAG: hypothetical protein KGZ70_09270, partial [Hydrogenophaga sp.]|nr:hypothetical protein [Hydrogenophaga sp.]